QRAICFFLWVSSLQREFFTFLAWDFACWSPKVGVLFTQKGLTDTLQYLALFFF
ncbi:hypothetical protein X975_06026, partial [Stegodyphus mimosarum]